MPSDKASLLRRVKIMNTWHVPFCENLGYASKVIIQVKYQRELFIFITPFHIREKHEKCFAIHQLFLHVTFLFRSMVCFYYF